MYLLVLQKSVTSYVVLKLFFFFFIKYNFPENHQNTVGTLLPCKVREIKRNNPRWQSKRYPELRCVLMRSSCTVANYLCFCLRTSFNWWPLGLFGCIPQYRATCRSCGLIWIHMLFGPILHHLFLISTPMSWNGNEQDTFNHQRGSEP